MRGRCGERSTSRERSQRGRAGPKSIASCSSGTIRRRRRAGRGCDAAERAGIAPLSSTGGGAGKGRMAVGGAGGGGGEALREDAARRQRPRCARAFPGGARSGQFPGRRIVRRPGPGPSLRASPPPPPAVAPLPPRPRWPGGARSAMLPAPMSDPTPAPEISVVIPAYNEVESLPILLAELRPALEATGRTLGARAGGRRQRRRHGRARPRRGRPRPARAAGAACGQRRAERRTGRRLRPRPRADRRHTRRRPAERPGRPAAGAGRARRRRRGLGHPRAPAGPGAAAGLVAHRERLPPLGPRRSRNRHRLLVQGLPARGARGPADVRGRAPLPARRSACSAARGWSRSSCRTARGAWACRSTASATGSGAACTTWWACAGSSRGWCATACATTHADGPRAEAENPTAASAGGTVASGPAAAGL